jgi:hypothetical protein
MYERGGISDQSFLHRTPVCFALIGTAVAYLINFGVLAFFVSTQQSVVILHYNVYFGVDLIGERWQAFLIPSFSLAFVAVNTLLAGWLYAKGERMASYMLLFASCAVGAGTFFACASIALINY